MVTRHAMLHIEFEDKELGAFKRTSVYVHAATDMSGEVAVDIYELDAVDMLKLTPTLQSIESLA